MEPLFSRLAHWIGAQLGKPLTFAAACTIVILWGVSGPFFGYSDTWQLVINTGTTIITFLMVFLLQHTQDRDTRVIQLKLDELIRSSNQLQNALLGLYDVSDEGMRRLRDAQAGLANGRSVMERADDHLGRAVDEAEAQATASR